MNPRYQIFISSTFRDLKKERQAVLDAILDLEHFPAGMEVFPAADAAPWDLIETMIAESDYYVLIIGGVYGSTDESGISYTEREYNFAVSRGIPILAFLHGDPSMIPMGMSEIDHDARQRLSAFRERVELHHCKYWSSPEDLKSKVVVGIVHEIKVNPRTGWIRGDRGDSAETLKKLTSALEENAQLKEDLRLLREALAVRTDSDGELALGSDTVEVGFRSTPHTEWRTIASWDELFRLIGPRLLSEVSERILFYSASSVAAEIFARTRPPEENAITLCKGAELASEDFRKIIYQFMAYDYVEPVTIVNQTDSFGRPKTERSQGYKLTRFGAQTLARLNAIRRRS